MSPTVGVCLPEPPLIFLDDSYCSAFDANVYDSVISRRWCPYLEIYRGFVELTGQDRVSRKGGRASVPLSSPLALNDIDKENSNVPKKLQGVVVSIWLHLQDPTDKRCANDCRYSVQR